MDKGQPREETGRSRVGTVREIDAAANVQSGHFKRREEERNTEDAEGFGNYA